MKIPYNEFRWQRVPGYFVRHLANVSYFLHTGEREEGGGGGGGEGGRERATRLNSLITMLGYIALTHNYLRCFKKATFHI